jgi:3-hydroxyisobutyrate dehydrogenase
MMTKIGFAGIGIMGQGMATNLVRSGHDVLAWNRTEGKAEKVSGASVATNIGQLGASCDVVMICVSDTPDVQEVANGLFETMTSGIIVDHSTISPSATKSLAEKSGERGITWIDAPVSGGSEGATHGTLAIMVGGNATALERVRPFLETYATSVTHVGDEPGSGQMAKMVNQVLVVLNQLAVSEALLLADTAGLDLDKTIEAVAGGAGGSWMLSNRGPQMVEGDWRPGFTIDLQQKDLRLVLEAADELGVPTPGVALVFQMYRALQNRGLGSEGNHALIKALESMAGLELGRSVQ